MNQMLLDTLRPAKPGDHALEGEGSPPLSQPVEGKRRNPAPGSGFWLLLAGQQDFEVAFAVPPRSAQHSCRHEDHGAPDPKVRIRVRGLRKDASVLSEKDVHAELDLSLAAAGRRSVYRYKGSFHAPERASVHHQHRNRRRSPSSSMKTPEPKFRFLGREIKP